MHEFRFPEKFMWPEITKRPSLANAQLEEVVQSILDSVKKEGDLAIRRYSEQFDRVVMTENLLVSPDQIKRAGKNLSPELKTAIQLASANIEKFHIAQKEPTRIIETQPGVKCWHKSVPLEKVGLYIPGGTAPLFSSVLMLGIPARIAQCAEIILCSPPDERGKIDSAILYAAHSLGIQKIFKVGGAQAIAAMAYGTESIPKVYKIFGPGNQYVTMAKLLVTLDGVAIDMPAGPSEVAVIADETADPDFIAADLLSQAEHGVDSHVVFLTTSELRLNQVKESLKQQLLKLPRQEIAEKALQNSILILFKNILQALEFANMYAPEHLILMLQEPNQIAEKVRNAGSVFLGKYAPESAGDYASGTNHTLPTNGMARSFGGVSLDSFMKKITFQDISPAGLQNIAPAIMTMAQAEQLYAHKRAVEIRLERIHNRSRNGH
jgi:histidinol dehydrogenase